MSIFSLVVSTTASTVWLPQLSLIGVLSFWQVPHMSWRAFNTCPIKAQMVRDAMVAQRQRQCAKRRIDQLARISAGVHLTVKRRWIGHRFWFRETNLLILYWWNSTSWSRCWHIGYLHQLCFTECALFYFGDQWNGEMTTYCLKHPCLWNVLD